MDRLEAGFLKFFFGRLSALDKYVIFSIAMLLIFTVVSFFIGTKYNYTNDALTTCFFGAFGGETFFCAIIKIFKIKNGGDEN